MPLYPHQREAIKWLLQHPRGGLFDDQGLGKTISALVAADIVGERILIVCPSVVAYNWAAECLEWTGRNAAVLSHGRATVPPGACVVVTTHGLLLREHIKAEIECFAPDVVIGDEVHMLRGRDSKKAAAFWGELVPPAAYVWALTGTPQPAWPIDLWMMLSHMWPQQFPESWAEFRDKYCLLAPSDYSDGWRPIGGRNLAELRQRVDGKFLRRLKSQVLDLPPLRHERVTLQADLPQEMLDLDGVLSEEAVEAVMNATSPEAAFAALLQDTDLASYRRRCGEAKAPLVAELLDLELREDRACKRVVFCHHKSVASTLAHKLAHYRPVLITGEVPAKQRTDRVALFQANPSVRVAVCQIVAGGTGITLTAADDLVFAEVSFLPGENAQARDRVYRIGQTKPCRVRFVELFGTADAILTRVLRRKTAAIRGLLGN